MLVRTRRPASARPTTGIRYDWQRPMILFTSDGSEVVVTQLGEGDQPQPSTIRRLSVADGTQIGETVPNRVGIEDWMWLDEAQRQIGLADRTVPMAAVDLRTGRQAEVPFLAPTAWTLDFSPALGRYVVGGPLGISVHDPSWTGPLERRIPIVAPDGVDFRGGPGAGYGIEEGQPTHEQALSGDGERLLVSVFDYFLAKGRFAAQYDLTEDDPAPRIPDVPGLYRGDGGYTLHAGLQVFGDYSVEPLPGLSGGITMLDGDLQPLGGTVGWRGFSENRGPSPDGRFFVVQWLSEDSNISTLYRADGTRVIDLELPGPPGWLEFSFAGDGSRVAAHEYNGDEWAIWDTETGDIVDQGPRPGAPFLRPWLAGDTLYVSSLSPNGEAEYAIQRLDPVTYEPIGEPLIGHRANRASIVDNGAGELIVSQSYQGDVRLWDRATGEQVGRADQDWFGSPSRAVQLSDDGTVMTRITGAYVSVWNLDIDTWADVACEFAGRNMTAEEWDEFGPDTIDHRTTCPQYPLHP